MTSDDDLNENPCLIVCAALRHRETGLIIAGARHKQDVMRPLMEALGGYEYWRNSESGFIDQKGEFLDRRRAWEIASAAGQIRHPEIGTPGTCFSENLY
jgi:hypothetical protein